MLFQISQKIVCIWRREGIIAKGSEEVYLYGVQLLLSTTINIFCIMLISCCTKRPFAWIPFLCGFIPLRITAGGFHAKTPLKCTLSFCGSFLIIAIVIQFIQHYGLIISSLFNSIVTLIIITFLSPIPASNKPLLDDEKRRNRLLSLIIASGFFLIVVTSVIFHIALEVSLYITFGELTASIFLCVSKVQLRTYR